MPSPHLHGPPPPLACLPACRTCATSSAARACWLARALWCAACSSLSAASAASLPLFASSSLCRSSCSQRGEVISLVFRSQRNRKQHCSIRSHARKSSFRCSGLQLQSVAPLTKAHQDCSPALPVSGSLPPPTTRAACHVPDLFFSAYLKGTMLPLCPGLSSKPCCPFSDSAS